MTGTLPAIEVQRSPAVRDVYIAPAALEILGRLSPREAGLAFGACLSSAGSPKAVVAAVPSLTPDEARLLVTTPNAPAGYYTGKMGGPEPLSFPGMVSYVQSSWTEEQQVDFRQGIRDFRVDKTVPDLSRRAHHQATAALMATLTLAAVSVSPVLATPLSAFLVYPLFAVSLGFGTSSLVVGSKSDATSPRTGRTALRRAVIALVLDLGLAVLLLAMVLIRPPM